jgi:hypothetical protein
MNLPHLIGRELESVPITLSMKVPPIITILRMGTPTQVGQAVVVPVIISV